MYIMLIERFVERCEDATSRDYQKITEQEGWLIDDYNSSFVPRKGEVILIGSGEAYDVVEVIYRRDKCDPHSENIIDVMLEVEPHKYEHTYTNGSYSRTESWPLIGDIFI